MRFTRLATLLTLALAACSSEPDDTAIPDVATADQPAADVPVTPDAPPMDGATASACSTICTALVRCASAIVGTTDTCLPACAAMNLPPTCLDCAQTACGDGTCNPTCVACLTATCLGGMKAPDDVPASSSCNFESDCIDNPAGPHCDLARGRCVACRRSDDCPSGQACDASGACVATGCTSDSQCSGSTPYCHPGTHDCEVCAPGHGCEPGHYCDSHGRCTSGCAADSDCAGTTFFGRPSPHCDASIGLCEQCVTDAHCPSGSVCSLGSCVAGCSASSPCPSGQSCCGDVCIDTSTSPFNCGSCGNRCPSPVGATPACVASTCGAGACIAGHADCNGSPADGCEVDTSSSPANCGACGARCGANANAAAGCAGGRCANVCDAGFGDCDGNVANGCETDLRASATHCGACGRSCAVANGTGVCAAGACVTTCATGYMISGASCVRANACLTDNGGCSEHATCTWSGTAAACACRAGYTGDGHTCTNTCSVSGAADCDGNAANGCETNTATDNANCGGCRVACSPANGTGSCTAGVCRVTGCNTGYALSGGACAAVNPCATDNGGCDVHATCAMSGPGARTCTCNSGYTGAGTSCAPESTCAPVCGAGQTCVSRVCVGSGPLRFTLTWDVGADLDFHVLTPAGHDIWARNRSADGGTLDRDANNPSSSVGPENIYWSTTPAPGRYVICVDPYAVRSGTTPHFTVTVNRPGVPAVTFTGMYSASWGTTACSASARTYVGTITI